LLLLFWGELDPPISDVNAGGRDPADLLKRGYLVVREEEPGFLPIIWSNYFVADIGGEGEKLMLVADAAASFLSTGPFFVTITCMEEVWLGELCKESEDGVTRGSRKRWNVKHMWQL
jgi:hypothetical protein